MKYAIVYRLGARWGCTFTSFLLFTVCCGCLYLVDVCIVDVCIVDVCIVDVCIVGVCIVDVLTLQCDQFDPY